MTAQGKSIKGIKSTKSIKSFERRGFTLFSRSERGFTLIELMVSIAIIAILAAVGLVVYGTTQQTGRISKRMQDLDAMRTAIELFRTNNGFYPSVTTAGTFVCLDSLTGSNAIAPTFMPIVPRDPIQPAGTSTNCYQYTSNATGASPTATEYKLRTNVPNTEMDWVDFNQQPQLIDPAHDGSIGSGATSCTVNALTANVTAQGWAYYTNADATCLY